ncbi:MAG: ABC transporter permease [Gemmatimonadota bacterium]|nr:ABC transporter permease [Gemmatimonadota bacterium]
MRLAASLGENVAVALDTLRVSKLRSGLTILGVVIGVSTVMAMAAIVEGIRDQIVHTIEIAGPTTFYLMRIFSQTPINPDRLPKYVRIRPELKEDEAIRIKELPEIGYASIWAQVFARIEFQGQRTQLLTVFGADDRFTEIQGGELTAGRWFTHGELSAGSGVIVLSEDVAHRLFARAAAVGKTIRVQGRPAQVIGLYAPPGNIFSPPGQDVGGIIPYRLAEHQLTFDKTNTLFICVKPRPGVSVMDAEEAVTVLERKLRHLGPAEPNTFDLITQDQILDIFNSFTTTFFLIMMVLSGVALLVGGIGVMAIMMVSVTDRTREIGVRKALGARRSDILQQFLVEAATLTGIGGLLGIVVGLATGRLVTTLMHIEARTPLLLTVIAVAVSVGIGLTFGLLPAYRAARLDPIDALRYE